MKVAFPAFEAAVSKSLSPRAGKRLRDAWAVVRSVDQSADELEDEQLGETLALALLTAEPKDAEPVLDLMLLTAVELADSGDAVTLPAADALGHPLLRDWLGASLDQALGRPMRAGVMLQQTSDDAPTFGDVELIEHEGRVVRGMCALRFRNADVVAHYGETYLSLACATRITVSGDALYGVGVDARRGVVSVPDLASMFATAVRQAAPSQETRH